MPYRVFTLDEAAEYLHLPCEDLQRLAHYREVPCTQQGKRLIFRKQELDAWASRRILEFSRHRLDEYHHGSTRRVRRHRTGKADAIVTELLLCPGIEPVLGARTRAAVLRDMAQVAERTGLLLDTPLLLASLQEREKLCSTALPGGYALLHPRHHDPYLFADSFVALGRTPHPVPFGAPDGGQTDLFFLVCCQDDRIHLHVLARLCVLCAATGLLAELRRAQAVADLAAAVRAAEAQVLASAQSG
jgi:excisionase family DNA binding protein